MNDMTLKINRDALDVWSYGSGTTACGTFNNGGEMGLVFRAIPDATILSLEEALARGEMVTETDVMRQIPPHAPTLLIRLVDLDAINGIIEDLLRLKFEVMGMDPSEIDKLFAEAQLRAEGLIGATEEVPEKEEEVAEETPSSPVQVPSFSEPITTEQMDNLVMLAQGLILFTPACFDARYPPALLGPNGEGIYPYPHEVWERRAHPDLFKSINAAAFAALAFAPVAGMDWSEYTTRIFGISPSRNPDVWSYIFGGAIAFSDGFTAADVTRRITETLEEALRA